MSDNTSLVCVECGAKNPAKYAYCYSCGSSLPTLRATTTEESDAPERTGIVCPKCRSANREGYQYCAHCGFRLDRRYEPKKALVVPLFLGAVGGLVGAVFSYSRGALPMRVAFAAVFDFGIWWAIAAAIAWLMRPSWRRAAPVAVAVVLTATVAGAYLCIQYWTGQSLAYIELPAADSQPTARSQATPFGTEAIVSKRATAFARPSPTAPPTVSAAVLPKLGALATRPVGSSLPSTSAPVQPGNPQATRTRGTGWFDQTVTTIDNRLATAAADATVASHQRAETPTSAVCRENVVISTPRHGSAVRGYVDIHGTASLPNFQFYKLEFSSRAEPTSGEWITIGNVHNQPVVNGKLETWDTSNLPAGQHWLRLVVVDQTGNYPEPCQVMIIVSK